MTPAEPDAVWRALADPTRRAILDELAERPRTTGELVARFGDLCRTGVMKHLDVLEAAGLLEQRRDARLRWNYVNPGPIHDVCERWMSRHLRHLSGAVTRLKDHVERSPDRKEEDGWPTKRRRK